MKVIAILSSILLSAQGSVLNRVDDVRVRVHVMGPVQPVADVEIGMISECPSDPSQPATYARTNAEGWAELMWHRCDRNVVMIFAASRLGDTAEKLAPSTAQAAELRRLDDLGMGPYVKRIEIPSDAAETIVEFSAPGGRKITFELTGDVATAKTAYLYSEEMAMPVPHAVSPTTHAFSVTGIRRGPALSAYLSISNRDQCSREIPVEIPTGDQDTSVSVVIPQWTPSASVDLSVNRAFTAAQQPHQTIGRFLHAYETIISENGSTIITFGRTQSVDEPGNGLSNDRFRRKIPAGTYYYSPGSFVTGGAGPRLLERIKSGEDLTNSGVPKFTVAAEETATLSVSWVDAWKAIFKLP